MAEDAMPGEGHKELPGEGALRFPEGLLTEEVIVEKYLTFEEASKCLNTFGRDESGMRYAYLMITATDRKLTTISTILNFKHVLFVDVSGNLLNLESLQVLTEMPYMILLKAERNRVDSAALAVMPFLQVLSLSNNQILRTCDMYQPMLEHLNLNHNQLYTAELDGVQLPELKQLEMRGNYFPNLGGTYPPSLEKLYMAENRISRIIEDDIEKLANLKILHLRDNYIRKLNGFTGYLENLTYLNLRKNKINKFRQFRKLQCLPRLETLIVLQNPVAGDADAGATPRTEDEEEEDEDEAEHEDITRMPLLVLLPSLKRINKVPVSPEEREEMDEVKEEKLEEIMAEESSEDDETLTTGPTTPYGTEVEDSVAQEAI